MSPRTQLPAYYAICRALSPSRTNNRHRNKTVGCRGSRRSPPRGAHMAFMHQHALCSFRRGLRQHIFNALCCAARALRIALAQRLAAARLTRGARARMPAVRISYRVGVTLIYSIWRCARVLLVCQRKRRQRNAAARAALGAVDIIFITWRKTVAWRAAAKTNIVPTAAADRQ